MWRRGEWVPGVLMLLSCGKIPAADLDQGQRLYEQHCEACHGPAGRGRMPGTPDLSMSDSMLVPDAVLAQVIENGAGTMPAYYGILRPHEIMDVIAYMRTLD